MLCLVRQISAFFRNTQRGDNTEDTKALCFIAQHTPNLSMTWEYFVSQDVRIHRPVETILCQSVVLLGLIRILRHFYSSLPSLTMSCFVVVRSKLQCVSVVGNFITRRKCCKLSNVERK